MTTMTLTIDDSKEELIEAFRIFVSNFQGVSLQIDRNESKEEKRKFSYIDEIGDKVIVIDGQEYIEPTKEDIEAIYHKGTSENVFQPMRQRST